MKSKILAWISLLFISIGSQAFHFGADTIHAVLSAGLVLGIVALFFYYDEN